MASVDKSAASVQGTTSRDRRSTARLIAAGLLGAVLAVFGALNSQTVRIHWIVTTTRVPMIVVILASGVVGALVVWLFSLRRRARR